MRRVLILVAVLLGGGCVPIAMLGPGDSTKEVVAKRAPELLVAGDGSVCGVSRDRFEAVDVGQVVRCHWR